MGVDEMEDWQLRQLLRLSGFDPGDAVWVARYPDRSGIVAFPSELEALRYAVVHSMEVVKVPYGEDVGSYREES